MVVCAVALLGIGASTAAAAPTAQPGWQYESSFGSANLEPFLYETPRSPVAVDSSGDIFAANQNNGVKIFGPGGGYLTEMAFGSLPRNLAIDLSDDAVYLDEIAAFGGSQVKRYVSDGAPTPTYTLDPSFEVPMGEGIAVDPTSGDLLVADPGAEGVRRYDTAGTLLETIATPGIATAWVVAAPDGSIYVAPAEGPDVTHLSGTGAPIDTISGVGAPEGLTYDASRSALVAAVGGNLKTYSAAGTGVQPSHAEGGIGIAADPAGGRLYEHTTVGIDTYDAVTVPGTEAPVVSAVTGHTAHVSAEVDPGSPLPAGSAAHFEYSADGGATWLSTPEQALAGPTTIEADLSGLGANLEYRVRVLARNSRTSKVGVTASFSTSRVAPTVETGSAVALTESGATLTGRVSPEGMQTSYYFEYGLSADYGSRVPAQSGAVAGNGRSALNVSRAVDGLVPGLTYHYRLVAENAAGTGEGSDRTFTAGASVEGRAYEQVTPVDGDGSNIDPTFGALALSGRDGFSYVEKPAGGEDVESAPFNMRQLSLRSTDGWSRPIHTDPPMRTAASRRIQKLTLAVSEDGTRAFVVTNAKLTPEAATGEETANLYIKDLRDGSYQFVASTTEPFSLRDFSNVGAAPEMFLAGADDFHWLVFFSNQPLKSGVTSKALYRWSAAGLEVISKLPDGTIPAAPVQQESSATPLIARQMVSADGSRILFGILNGGTYLWENGTVIPLSVPEGGGEAVWAKALALDTSGRYAFFFSFWGLAPGAPANPGALYRADVDTGDIEYVGEAAWAGGPSNAVTYTYAVAPDGRSVLFLEEHPAPSPLPERQLKFWREGDVTTLWEGPGSEAHIQSAQFSPDSRYLVYSDATNAQTGSASLASISGDIFVVDAATGGQSCVSCLNGEPTDASFLPSGERIINNHLPRTIDSKHEVFFDSAAALDPRDTNGELDVYVYRDGQASLITPGSGAFPAYLMDVSEAAVMSTSQPNSPLWRRTPITNGMSTTPVSAAASPARTSYPPRPAREKHARGPWPASPPSHRSAPKASRRAHRGRCRGSALVARGRCERRAIASSAGTRTPGTTATIASTGTGANRRNDMFSVGREGPDEGAQANRNRH
jgi:hypothetical protein